MEMKIESIITDAVERAYFALYMSKTSQTEAEVIGQMIQASPLYKRIVSGEIFSVTGAEPVQIEQKEPVRVSSEPVVKESGGIVIPGPEFLKLNPAFYIRNHPGMSTRELYHALLFRVPGASGHSVEEFARNSYQNFYSMLERLEKKGMGIRHEEKARAKGGRPEHVWYAVENEVPARAVEEVRERTKALGELTKPVEREHREVPELLKMNRHAFKTSKPLTLRLLRAMVTLPQTERITPSVLAGNFPEYECGSVVDAISEALDSMVRTKHLKQVGGGRFSINRPKTLGDLSGIEKMYESLSRELEESH